MLKKILIGIAVLVLGIVLFCTGYVIIYSQGVIESSEVNSAELPTKILIGSQGSGYKEALVQKLVSQLGNTNTYIKVIDVTTLGSIDEADWNAIILITSIEYYAAQKDVAAFIEESQQPEKIILFATSGQGDMGPQECRIDAITTASETANIDEKTEAIMTRLGELGIFTQK